MKGEQKRDHAGNDDSNDGISRQRVLLDEFIGGCFSTASPAPSLAPSAAPSEIDPRTTRETRLVGDNAMLLMLGAEAVEE